MLYGISAITFQLTHPWGCDFNNYETTQTISAFQLTHPWGCDLWPHSMGYHCRISTHTPVRVWPALDCLELIIAQISTHTPVRVWLNFQNSYHISNGFQLTHPWGCDKMKFTSATNSQNFNSHTREGVTIKSYVILKTWKISTHTPVRVWPNAITPRLSFSVISTHTPVRVWL